MLFAPRVLKKWAALRTTTTTTTTRRRRRRRKKWVQQQENETSDHGNPKQRLPDPVLEDLGRWKAKKGLQQLESHSDPKRPKISAAERSKRSPGSFNLIQKRSKKSTPKFFFKTVGNSIDALKEHQANSKISSGSLFSGPQSLFVPATTTTTTTTTRR